MLKEEFEQLLANKVAEVKEKAQEAKFAAENITCRTATIISNSAAWMRTNTSLSRGYSAAK
mgnify:CR=1 FL=1